MNLETPINEVHIKANKIQINSLNKNNREVKNPKSVTHTRRIKESNNNNNTNNISNTKKRILQSTENSNGSNSCVYNPKMETVRELFSSSLDCKRELTPENIEKNITVKVNKKNSKIQRIINSNIKENVMKDESYKVGFVKNFIKNNNKNKNNNNLSNSEFIKEYTNHLSINSKENGGTGRQFLYNNFSHSNERNAFSFLDKNKSFSSKNKRGRDLSVNISKASGPYLIKKNKFKSTKEKNMEKNSNLYNNCSNNNMDKLDKINLNLFNNFKHHESSSTFNNFNNLKDKKNYEGINHTNLQNIIEVKKNCTMNSNKDMRHIVVSNQTYTPSLNQIANQYNTPNTPNQKIPGKNMILKIHANNNNSTLKESIREHIKEHLKNMNNDKNDEFFEYSKEKPPELTKEEKTVFGERIMKGHIRKRLLGKGGCGIVWLCIKTKNSNEVAVKQTAKKNNITTMNIEDNLNIARNEIKILNLLNNCNSENIENSSKNSNKNSNKNSHESYEDSFDDNCELIPKIFSSYEDNNDIWFSFEKGGQCLSNLSFKIKGEFEKGERIYKIQKGRFLFNLFKNIKNFKYLVKQLLIGIDFINKKGIIHSDIKPENILVELTNDNKYNIKNIKIIDYGSAFYVKNTSSISSNTPEYLCPEITSVNKKFLKDLSTIDKYVNSIDIWSLGITLLELCLCCPIWMSYKSKIILNGKAFYSNGIFGCRGRDSNKIYQKQLELSKNMNKILSHSMLYLWNKEEKDLFEDLISKMLNIDYKKRITTHDALEHQFLNNIYC